MTRLGNERERRGQGGGALESNKEETKKKKERVVKRGRITKRFSVWRPKEECIKGIVLNLCQIGK